MDTFLRALLTGRALAGRGPRKVIHLAYSPNQPGAGCTEPLTRLYWEREVRIEPAQWTSGAGMEDDTLRILVGDAQPRVRFGLRVLLEEQPGWRVVAEAADTAALLELVRDGCPDVVLVDWGLPGLPPDQTLVALRRACPRVRVVSMSSKDDLRQPALQLGADLFVYKADPPDRLLQLIRGLTANHVAP